MHTRLARIARNRWVMLAATIVPIAVSIWSLNRAPRVSLAPVLPALGLWIVGKYVLCPLRWRAVTGGRTRWWHLRAYAESELLGLLSPGHVGADLWRVGRLCRSGLSGGAATASVALDRLVGATALIMCGLLVGVTLPLTVALALLAVGVVVAAVAWWVRARRGVALPRVRTLGYGLALSLGYQASIVALLLATVSALDRPVAPLSLMAVYTASQLAGIIPGVNGLSAREAALAVGIASLDVSWSAAAGAVALMSVMAWPPALLLGGSGLVAGWLTARRPRSPVP